MSVVGVIVELMTTGEDALVISLNVSPTMQLVVMVDEQVGTPAFPSLVQEKLTVWASAMDSTHPRMNSAKMSLFIGLHNFLCK